MKRDLLAQSLANMNKKAEAPPPAAPAGNTATDGAPKSLRNMSEVLSQVASQAAQDVDVAEIADSDLSDRFDVTVGLEPLVDSIRNSGQQLPVLLRYRRGAGPRYEVVYGRRRIAACRVLGIKVRAFIKEMDLRESLLSQALENSARLERSFIEQAVFATELETAEFSRQEICEALAVDKGTLSRLLSVVRDIPAPVIRRIGAAHDVGRRPWSELRRLVKLEIAPSEDGILDLIPEGAEDAQARVYALIEALQKLERKSVADARAKPASVPPRQVPNAPVSFSAKGGKMVIEVRGKRDEEFIQFIGDRLEALYGDWIKERD
ncbi:plasmid partitioning protein RepB (plasmid) [Salipiger sp. H15]|uniref:Plasmid partitioning protein RepB n=1 Tax=Alloyangia sp. H15 TaxID=3029062 RepID=A0AAU8ASY5_9RHOB